MDPLIIFGFAFGVLLTWACCKHFYEARRHASLSLMSSGRDVQPSSIPVTQFDLSVRYDIYCTLGCEERLYEGVRIVGVRTFDRLTEFSGAIGGLLEIEAANGARGC
jgi:hypothetical protein